MNFDQGLCLGWQFSETVHDLFKQRVYLIGVLRGGKFLVEGQAQMNVAAVVVRQQSGRMQIDIGRGAQWAKQIRFDAGFQAAHGLGQHFVVKLKADFEHVAALVLAQHLASAANFQIVHRQVEPAAQFFHLLNGIQALAGLLGQPFQIRDHQVSIGLMVASAHTPAQLVQLGQAKLVGATDDDGIGGRHIDAGLDDGRAQQKIEALRDKVPHHRLELALRHLSMRYGNVGLRQQFFELGTAVFNGLHFIVQKIDLSTAFELAQHGFPDHAMALGADKGLDREATLWCGRNHTQITQAFECHAQCARDRCGGQCQYVDIRSHGLHGLLVAHAETMFLVNDEQAQIVELRALTEQLVGSYNDVYRSVGQPFQSGRDFSGRAKAAHFNDLDRPLGKTVNQCLVMLLRQQSCRSQQRHLFASRDADKGGAQSDFGLAKADVTADQAIHRSRADHVLNYGVNGRALVRRFFKAKIVGKGFIVGWRIAKGVALPGGATGIDVEQFCGAVTYLFGCLASGLLPLTRAQFVQGCLVGADAGIAADQLQLTDRHIKHGLIGILQMQEFLHFGFAIGS